MSTLQPFRKDFYQPHPNVTTRSSHVVEAYRSDKEITVKVQTYILRKVDFQIMY